MRVGIIQSNYIPWRGYFDFINSVDMFIIYDDVQYSTGSFRNRNIIKDKNKSHWITVPVKNNCGFVPINEIKIDYKSPWQLQHSNKITFAYNKAPFFEAYFEKIISYISANETYLSTLNVKILHWICDQLDIKTPLVRVESLNVSGSKTQRLIDILQKVNATAYLSGPAAAAYLDVGLFAEAGIQLEYKTYDYDQYPQLYPPFVGNVTILDLLFNVGPEAKNYITSKTPNAVVFSPVSKPKRIYA